MKYLIDTEKGTCEEYKEETQEEQKEYTTYSQNDPQWKNKKLGNSTTSTIGNYGCYITALANLTGRYTPYEVNNILVAKGLFNGDLLKKDFQGIAEALELKCDGQNNDGWYKPDFDTIKEVKMNRSQHFVLRVYNNGKPFIIDSWDGQKKDNQTYPFESYRLFKR